MKNHVPYNENKLAHQEPVIAISQWQEHNDFDGWEEEEMIREVLVCMHCKQLRVVLVPGSVCTKSWCKTHFFISKKIRI